MSLSTNTTYRVFLDKLGGTDPASFVGDAGELFFDPSIPALKLSDGSTPGGVGIGTSGGGGISNVVEDTTPQLGGHLDVNGKDIVSTGNGNIQIVPDTDGDVIITTSGAGIVSVNGETTIDGRLSVNTIEGTGEVGVTRMLLQASNNGNSYISIPTDDASTTTNLVIGNELRGIQLVGGVVLDSDVENPQLSGGSNGSPTNIPLTLGYAVLNEGVGGDSWFNLPDGQEGQLFHLVVGSTDSGTAADFSITIANARYTEDVGGGVIQPTTGSIVWNPFVTETTPVSMATVLFAQSNWNIGIGGTVTPD